MYEGHSINVDSPALVIEVDTESVEKSSKSNKKRGIESAAPASGVESAIPTASTNIAAPWMKNSHAGERSLTGRVAEMLFGDVHHPGQVPKPTASGIAAHPNPPAHCVTPLPTLSSYSVQPVCRHPNPYCPTPEHGSASNSSTASAETGRLLSCKLPYSICRIIQWTLCLC